MAGHVWNIKSGVGRVVAPLCRSDNWQNYIQRAEKKSETMPTTFVCEPGGEIGPVCACVSGWELLNESPSTGIFHRL